MSDRCPPPLALERFLQSEIAGSTSAPWTSHIEGCAKCRARLDEMHTEDRALAARVRARVEGVEPPRTVPFFRMAAIAMAAAAAILLFVLLPEQNQNWGVKGRGLLGLMVEKDGVVHPWDGSSIAIGSRIQLTWTAETPGHLLVRTEEEVLFPAALVAAGRDVPVGGSLRVDAVHDGLVISAFFSNEPLDPSQLDDHRAVSRVVLRVR